MISMGKLQFRWREMLNPAAPPATPAEPHEHILGAVAHLTVIPGALLTSFLGAAGASVGPFVVMDMQKDKSAFATDQATEAINFCLTMLGLMLLSFVAASIGLPWAFTAFFALLAVLILWPLRAAWQAWRGIAYRYAIALRPLR